MKQDTKIHYTIQSLVMKKNSVLTFSHDLKKLIVTEEDGSFISYDLTGNGILMGLLIDQVVITENELNRSTDPSNTRTIDMDHPSSSIKRHFQIFKDDNQDVKTIIVTTDIVGSLTNGEVFSSQLSSTSPAQNNITIEYEAINLSKGSFVIKLDESAKQLIVGLANPMT